MTDEEIKEKLRTFSFIYADTRLSDREIVHAAELAWEEIYELEYEQAFGGWRGAHLDEENDTVCVTFDNAFGGPPLMVIIDRQTGEKRTGYPPEDFVLKENANLAKLMKSMGVSEEQCEKYRSMYIMPKEGRP